MKTVKADLPRNLNLLEIHIFADEHIGDPLSDLKRLKERINYVKDNPNAYCILNGDIIDNATRTSIGDCYAQELTPKSQLDACTNLFEPIKDKILYELLKACLVENKQIIYLNGLKKEFNARL